MQQFIRLAGHLSSPVILIVVVWGVALTGVAIGPIDFPLQPSPATLALVAGGVALFILGHYAGVWYFDNWFERQTIRLETQVRALNGVVVAASLVGLGGIGLIALDRLVLSGVGSGYAELLRCAPALVEFIQIKRTPLLYIGYLTFSFGFASLVLFLLKGEEIKGWAAILAQLSILSPVGYALLYSGRMPILVILVLIIAAVLIRLSQGRRALPTGHHLLLKTVVLVVVFAVYSSSVWSSRQEFCAQMTGVIRELQQKMNERNAQQALALEAKQTKQAELKRQSAAKSAEPATGPISGGQKGPAGQTGPSTEAQQEESPLDREPSSPGTFSGSDLNKMVSQSKGLPSGAPSTARELLAIMQESWGAQPRGYVIAAIQSGHLSLATAKSVLSTYFYLSHGVRVIDTTWRARETFSPHWGVYEVGILSPILRVFFPKNQEVAELESQLRAAEIYGYFPTAWVAIFIDFGAVGSVVYILIWGFAAGWSFAGTKRGHLVLPPLLLSFVLGSILLSIIQGPLGLANSALVLVSMIVVGLAIDRRNEPARAEVPASASP
jgi:hypothetical protein